MLHCAVWSVPQAVVPAIVEGVGRWAVEEGYKRWRAVSSDYVKTKQKDIQFGTKSVPDKDDNTPADEYEGDEVVFRKQDIGNNEVQWLEGVGLKRRGDRASLVLEERHSKRSTAARAENGRAVPPPYTTEEWNGMRDRHVRVHALGHFGGAPAYKSQGEGQYRDAVLQWTKQTVHEENFSC